VVGIAKVDRFGSKVSFNAFLHVIHASSISLTSDDGTAGLIKRKISHPKDREAEDLLGFLFSFCDTSGGATQVKNRDGEVLEPING
jgi:hypothetical protein